MGIVWKLLFVSYAHTEVPAELEDYLLISTYIAAGFLSEELSLHCFFNGAINCQN